MLTRMDCSLESEHKLGESLQTEELVSSCYGLELHLVDATGAGLCRALQEVLPPEFGPPASSPSAMLSYLVAGDTDAETEGGPIYRIARDGSNHFGAATKEEALEWLQNDIDYTLARRSTRKLFVHAGVVGWRGLAILIPGRTFTGKSTLVAELVRRGAVYYSDEFAVLDDAAHVHPYRRNVVLRDEPSQTRDLRLRRENASAGALPIALIVAAPYQAGATWRPAILRGARATLPLIEATVLAREEPARILRIAGRVAPNIVTLQGPRSEAAEVAPRILDLVDDALASQALGAAVTHPIRLVAELAAIAEMRLRSKSARPAPPRRQLIPARYLRITDFLSPEDHRRVLAQALAHEDAFKDSGVLDDQGENRKDYGIRKSRTLHGSHLEPIWDLFNAPLRAMLAHIRKELELPWFPLGTVERQLTAHASGGFFAPHRDNGHADVANRRISCVYYFHASPCRFKGGELRLYDNWVTDYGSTAAATYTTISPIDNSIVFFPSDTFHEVRPVHRETDAFGDSRFAITIWFREGQWPSVVARTEPSTVG